MADYLTIGMDVLTEMINEDERPTLKNTYLTHEQCVEALQRVGLNLWNPAGGEVLGVKLEKRSPTHLHTQWHKYWIRNARSTRESLVMSAHFLRVFISLNRKASKDPAQLEQTLINSIEF